MTLVPTGTLRASINLGNPVLAQGSPEEPRGITVDLARELATRLDVPLDLLCFTAARDSFAALVDGRADVGFLAGWRPVPGSDSRPPPGRRTTRGTGWSSRGSWRSGRRWRRRIAAPSGSWRRSSTT